MKGSLSNISTNRIISAVILVIFTLLVISVTRTYIDHHGKEDVVQEARLKLEKAREENENLKRQLARTQTQDFVETEARNRLNLGKDGEIVILMPPITPIPEPLPTKADTRTNFRKWVEDVLL